jgi:radical SAM protein (TIGR01212 family)
MEREACRKLGTVLRERFGGPVHKVGLLAGFPCPSLDPAGVSAGCAFCNPASSLPPGISPGMSVTAQLEFGTAAVSRRFGARMYIAYFQDCTPTNCDPRDLEILLENAAGFQGVVGVALCTRPDCLDEPVLDVLARLAGRTFLWVEVGLQSASDATLARMGRHHTAGECSEAVGRLRARGITVVLHVILGLPGETEADFSRTADFARASGCWGVKIHNLLVLRGTRLEEDHAAGLVALPSLEEYASTAASFIDALGPGMVIHRVCADAPGSILIAPSWTRDKQAVIRAVDAALTVRRTPGAGAAPG